MTPEDLSLAVSDVYARTVTTGRITRSHRRILMKAICFSDLGSEERSAIDRLLWSASRGRFELVDE